ncbi:hypothetical protein PIB30_054449 [Stylosanthes scabra]|uniref:Uncharacterized protein n=1 Tax=Stylosanthes scabra TaxID=79078 RepID=A0ABU6SJP3_9FABA|nr:hypothetical protein [Stylosanthes scabra]
MASPASSHTKTTPEISQPDSSLQPTQEETLSQSAVPSASENAMPPSTMATNLSPPTSSKEKGKKKKKKEKPSGKETASIPPELLVVESTVPLTKDGFLKAPEPSIPLVLVAYYQYLSFSVWDDDAGGLPSNGDAISWNNEFNIGDSIALTLVVVTIRVGDNSLNLFRPLWVVDLWLKAIFCPRIPLVVDALPKKAVNRIQLTCLQKPSSRYSLESFCLYLSWFFDLKNDVDDETFDLFPFISLPLPSAPCFDTLDYPLDQQAGDEMWAYSLVPQKLRVGAPGDGTLEMR